MNRLKSNIFNDNINNFINSKELKWNDFNDIISEESEISETSEIQDLNFWNNNKINSKDFFGNNTDSTPIRKRNLENNFIDSEKTPLFKDIFEVYNQESIFNSSDRNNIIDKKDILQNDKLENEEVKLNEEILSQSILPLNNLSIETELFNIEEEESTINDNTSIENPMSLSSEETESLDDNSIVDSRYEHFHNIMKKARIYYLNENWLNSFQILQTLIDNNQLTIEERTAVLYNQALSLHEESEWIWALNIVDDLLLLNPQHSLAWELKGDLHMVLNEYDQARNAYKFSLIMEERPIVQLKKNESKFKILQYKVSEYLAILGLDPKLKDNLTNEILKSQYRKICKLLHPDCVSNAFDPSLIENRFNKVQEAYRFLREKCLEAEKRVNEGEKYQLLSFKSIASPNKKKSEYLTEMDL